MPHIKHNLAIFAIIVLLAFLFDFLGIRICLFYALFHLPCPGCGITRAAKALLAGDISRAAAYNWMIFPIGITCLFYCLMLIWKKTGHYNQILQKRKRLLIGISAVLALVLWCANVRNPLLYAPLS